MKDDWWKLLKGMEDLPPQIDLCPECQQPKDSRQYADECGSCIDDSLARHHNAEGDRESASRYAAYPETDNQNWQDSIETGEPMDNAWSSLLKSRPSCPKTCLALHKEENSCHKRWVIN